MSAQDLKGSPIILAVFCLLLLVTTALAALRTHLP
ncbi:hypothetical protein VIMS_01562 [Mycobacterium marinum]|nr:hypothetical protein VIMS_01562 [Mycobacterium marinum]